MSTLKTARNRISGMVKDMRSRTEPRVNIIGLTKTHNEGFARVVASVTHTAESRKDHNHVINAINHKLGNRVRPVEGSFYSLANNQVGETIAGIITANPEMVSVDDEVSGYKAVAGNMFMDDEEELWTLRKTEAGKLLVKSRGKEDADVIQDLMSSLSSSEVGTMGFEARSSVSRDENVRQEIDSADFITFVNPDSESVEFGAVGASVYNEDGTDSGLLAVVSSQETGAKYHFVDRQMVLAKFADAELGDDAENEYENVVESSGGLTIEQIAAYYQKMFQRDPSYFNKFWERWMNHNFA